MLSLQRALCDSERDNERGAHLAPLSPLHKGEAALCEQTSSSPCFSHILQVHPVRYSQC